MKSYSNNVVSTETLDSINNEQNVQISALKAQTKKLAIFTAVNSVCLVIEAALLVSFWSKYLA